MLHADYLSDWEEQNERSPCPHGVSPVDGKAANQQFQGAIYNDQIKRYTIREGHILFGGRLFQIGYWREPIRKLRFLRIKIY